MRRADFEVTAPGDSLRAALHSLCTEAGGWRMRQQEGVGLGRFFLFCGIALGGLAFDLVTKATVFSRVGPPPAPAVVLIPRVLELHTSQNTGALWGFGANLPGSSLIFAGLSVIAAFII